MHLPRTIQLESDARAALGQILGIMYDQTMSGAATRWDIDRLLELELRLGGVPGAIPGSSLAQGPAATGAVTFGIDDAALLLDGMAFTEIASADLPWIDMVRWTSDFVTGQLRSHWTDAEWLALASDPR